MTSQHVDIHTVNARVINNHNNKAVYPKSALFFCVLLSMDLSEQPVVGAAQRRRQRRLRSWLRHEWMTVAMALAERTHQSSRGQTIARAGVWGRELNYTATVRDPPPPSPLTPYPSRSSSASTKKSPAGRGRTGSLPCPRRRSEICGAPCSRSSILSLRFLFSMILRRRWFEQLSDVLQFFDALMPVPEQVIEVPKVLPEDVPVRTAVRDSQLAEHLVEVPTIVSFSSRQRIVEQIVDIPVVGVCGTGGGLSVFLPGQNYSMTAEQIVDKVLRRSFSGDLPGFFPRTVRRSGLRTRSLTFQFQVEVFKIFLKLFTVQGFRPICRTRQNNGFLDFSPGFQKVRRSRAPRGRNWVRSRAHGRHELSWLGVWWIDMGAALLWLLRGKSGPAWCVLLLVYPLTQWLGAAVGAGCARVPPVSRGGLWKNFLFYVAASSRNSHLESGALFPCPCIFQLIWRLGVWIFQERALLGSTVNTCFSRALEEFTYFLRRGELES